MILNLWLEIYFQENHILNIKLSNKLKSEKSPYLKQHENNPVDWLAWNKDSLKKAKVEKKPIFLIFISISIVVKKFFFK